MNKKHLRDAMDSYKYDVLIAAFPPSERRKRPLFVFAMRTDDNWLPSHWKLYAKITLDDEGLVERVIDGRRALAFSWRLVRDYRLLRSS